MADAPHLCLCHDGGVLLAGLVQTMTNEHAWMMSGESHGGDPLLAYVIDPVQLLETRGPKRGL